MKQLLVSGVFVATVVAALGASPREARADGLSVAPSKLAAGARSSLTQEIASFKQAKPELRARVRDVQGVKPEVYAKFQKPAPEASRELKALGKDALVPMLEVLAFEGSQTSLATRDRDALKLGMIAAVGELRDSRSVAVLGAILENQAGANDEAFAAASALGKVCDEAAFKLLDGKAADGQKLRNAALAGLGECRRLESANVLVGALRSAKDDATRLVAIRALGTLGSSWAWAAVAGAASDSAKVEQTGIKVRTAASDALIATFVESPTVRVEAKRAILKCEAPNALTRVRDANKGQNAETQKALDDLDKKLTRAAKRK